MNQEIITVSHAITSHNEIDWLFYFIFFGIVGIGSFIGSFFNEYAKKRGQQLATKADLDEIHNQLKRSTEITEQVKRDIEHGIWRAKELEVLKREKLEEYLINYYQVIDNFSKKVYKEYFKAESGFDESYEAKLSMLHLLYLPELDDVHTEFLKVKAEFQQWFVAGLQELLEKTKNGTPKPIISEEHMKHYSELLNHFNDVTLAVERKVKEIGRQLNTHKQ